VRPCRGPSASVGTTGLCRGPSASVGTTGRSCGSKEKVRRPGSADVDDSWRLHLGAPDEAGFDPVFGWHFTGAAPGDYLRCTTCTVGRSAVIDGNQLVAARGDVGANERILFVARLVRTAVGVQRQRFDGAKPHGHFIVLVSPADQALEVAEGVTRLEVRLVEFERQRQWHVQAHRELVDREPGGEAVGTLGQRRHDDDVLVGVFGPDLLQHPFDRRRQYTRRHVQAMRAMSDNVDLARVSGINTAVTVRWTWAIGAGLAAVAGVFAGFNFGAISPNLGFFLLLPLFASVILGGIGSPYGAMLGALVIGIAQTILIAPVTNIATAYKPGVAFLLMILMLIIRPQGLLGRAERKG